MLPWNEAWLRGFSALPPLARPEYRGISIHLPNRANRRWILRIGHNTALIQFSSNRRKDRKSRFAVRYTS